MDNWLVLVYRIKTRVLLKTKFENDKKIPFKAKKMEREQKQLPAAVVVVGSSAEVVSSVESVLRSVENT